jgi:formate hydrogenlyase subunit 3/multisubunit Na+/H+ antiporter MnhD subunit
MSALAAVLLPVALALSLAGPAAMRAWTYRLAPWAPLVMLWPLFADGRGLLPWPLLGMSFAVDAVARPLLLLTLVAWTLAGWFAGARITEHRRWFWTGWLGALAGMHMLLLAADLGTFYLGYATLSLSAYLLVTHSRKDEAWRAGRVYLVMALLGEAMLLVGILLIAGQLGNASLATLAAAPGVLEGSAARWFLLAGFAVKLGILPLHLWLPLAHPVAPVPASAILSGIIVKAGLIGWLRFVPALADDPAIVGQGLLVLGLLTAFGAVALGLGQARLKTVLAYSTISQMGLVLAGFSAMFLAPAPREAVAAMLGLLALHHGLNKASLFLACGSQPGATKLRMALFALPALALAAAPLTTGFVAKDALKQALAGAALGPLAGLLLSLSSTATALLMWRAFQVARREVKGEAPLHPAWPLMVLSAAALPWGYALAHGLAVVPSAAKLFGALWPLLLAAGLVLAYHKLWRGAGLALPEGDLVVLIERVLRRRPAFAHPVTRQPAAAPRPARWNTDPLLRFEQLLRRMPAIGLAMLGLGSLLWALSQLGVSG